MTDKTGPEWTDIYRRYTDEIIDFFKSQKHAWSPHVNEGRIYRNLVDISVRLRPDGEVSTSYSRSQRTPKIEIKDTTGMWLLPTANVLEK